MNSSAIIDFVFGALIMAQGISGIINGVNSKQAKKLCEKYTESSVALYQKLNGVVSVLVGLFFFVFGLHSAGVINLPIKNNKVVLIVAIVVLVAAALFISFGVLKKKQD